jgi:DNA-binding transcriptional MerR regulator
MPEWGGTPGPAIPWRSAVAAWSPLSPVKDCGSASTNDFAVLAVLLPQIKAEVMTHRPAAGEIPDKLYFKIGEASEIVGVEAHVLRYWEAEFKIIKPLRAGSRQRLYRRGDIENLLRIRELLYTEGYTVAGARQALKEGRGVGNRTAPPAAGENVPRELVDSLKKELRALKDLLED